MMNNDIHGISDSELHEDMESLPLDEPQPIVDPPSYADSVSASAPFDSSVPNLSEFVRVWVSEPRKELEFYSYMITTSTNIEDFGGIEFCVRRRFRDVVTLSERLSETRRGMFVPVRPDKSVALERQSEQFVEQRRAQLEKYLNKLANHPEIRRSEELKAFLSGIAPRSREEAAPAVTDGGGVMKMLKELRQSVANDWGRVKPLVVEEDKEFLERKEKLMEFENHLSSLSQQAESLVKAQQDMGETMEELGLAFDGLAKFEKEKAVLESQRTRAADVKNVANAATKSGRFYRDLNAKTVKHLDVLHDYLGVILAAHNAFSDRSGALLTVQTLSSELTSLQSRIEKLEAASSKVFGGDRSRMRKIVELKESVRSTEDAKSCAVREYEQIKENNRSELERLDDERRKDFWNMLSGFVNSEAVYAEKMANVWETLVEETRGYANLAAERTFQASESLF